MRTKQLLSLAFCILSCLGIVNCAKEEVPAQRVMELNSSRTKCLSQLTTQIERYFDGQSTRQDVDSFWNCVNDAFSLFRVYVRGSDRGSYTPNEIRSFFEIYFLGDIRISDGLLQEIVEIKKLLFGGGNQQITGRELDEVVKLLDKFHVWTVDLLPHIRVYMRQLNRRGDFVPTPEQIEAASSALQSVLDRFGATLAASQSNYEFIRLRALLFELSQLFISRNPNSRLGDLDKLFPVLVRVKLLLIGPNPVSIEPRDWSQLLRIAARFSTSWIRVREGFDQRLWFASRGLPLLRQAGDGFFEILEEGLNQRTDKIIPAGEFHSLLQEVDDLLDYSRIIRVDTLKSVVDVLLRSFLGRPVGEETPDLSLVKVRNLRSNWEQWLNIQRTTTEIAEDTGSGPSVNRTALLRELAHNQTFGARDFEALVRPDYPVPFNFDPNGSYLIRPTALDSLSLQGLGLLNLIRGGVRLLLNAYGENSTYELNRDQMRKAYLDFKPLAVDLGFVQPNDDSFFDELMVQADLFLPASDGNQRLSFREITEFILVALNSFAIANEMSTEMAELDPRCEGAEGSADQPPLRCLRELVLRSKSYEFLNLAPGLRTYLQSLNAVQREGVFNSLRKISFSGEATVSSGKLAEAATILQFTEVLISKFDADHNQLISVAEARLGAYPVFADALRGILPFIPDAFEREAFFTYLLKFGEPPDPALNPIHEIQFKYWIKNPELWDFAADRGRLIQVLGALNSF